MLLCWRDRSYQPQTFILLNLSSQGINRMWQYLLQVPICRGQIISKVGLGWHLTKTYNFFYCLVYDILCEAVRYIKGSRLYFIFLKISARDWACTYQASCKQSIPPAPGLRFWVSELHICGSPASKVALCFIYLRFNYQNDYQSRKILRKKEWK